MLPHCLKCRNNTESKNPRVTKISKGKIMLLSECAVYNGKKSKFIKEQEATWLLSQLGLKNPLSKITLSGDILF